jgi:hypothetical protein
MNYKTATRSDTTTRSSRRATHRRVKALSVIIIAGLAMPSLSAQSYAQGAAPQGGFCATYDDYSPEDCSFASMAMCQQSVSGVGGWCAPSASAPPMPPPSIFPSLLNLNAAPPPAFAPAAVPPPPPDQQGPLQLPDSQQQ